MNESPAQPLQDVLDDVHSVPARMRPSELPAPLPTGDGPTLGELLEETRREER